MRRGAILEKAGNIGWIVPERAQGLILIDPQHPIAVAIRQHALHRVQIVWRRPGRGSLRAERDGSVSVNWRATSAVASVCGIVDADHQLVADVAEIR